MLLTSTTFFLYFVCLGDESFTSSVSSDMSYSEPNVFVDETPTKGPEEKTDVRDEKVNVVSCKPRIVF